MDVKLSDIYQRQRPKLEKCKQWELCTEGYVWKFWENWTSYIRSCLNGGMDTKAVSFRGDSNEEEGTFSESTQGLRDIEEWLALSDMLQDVQEERKAILKFSVDLKAIYELNLVPDSVLLMRLLMKVQGSLLTFFGECIRH